jgi:ppGpp synthetase/RelA/SpoT-type nucleotidyltranferase
MTERKDPTDHQWACQQIEKYRALVPRYQTYTRTLDQVLRAAARRHATLSIVQTRAKTVPSFAEKIQRKAHKYHDPVNQLTDLCGGRVITHTYAEVEAICEFIKTHFVVDLENSVDIASRLKPTEFGYRSVHYVVQFRRDAFPNAEIDVQIPEALYPDNDGRHPMKAEIQVRTLLEHAWASFSHERVYKGPFTIPEAWQRELAGLAAMLEEADRAFSRIQTGLQTYAASYGAYMSPKGMRREMELLRIVLASDPHNAELAHRIGKLAIAQGDWQAAVEVLSQHADSGHQPILRDLGMALCKLHSDRPRSPDYVQGQYYLEMASLPPHHDPDALASLAGTYKATDAAKARDLYRQAFEADPTDPYAVENYLVAEIDHWQHIAPVAMMAPTIRAAMQRCRDQAHVGMNLPWAYYSLGMFHLLLGQPYDSLCAYAKAVQLSTDDWMIDTARRTLDLLLEVQQSLPGYEWMQKTLLIGGAAKFPEAAYLQEIQPQALGGHGPIPGPVVILAGGTDPSLEPQLLQYRQFLLEAFRDFRGTLLSGGTRAGVVGLAGEVQQAYPDSIHTIGYAPRSLPEDVALDTRYREIRSTVGDAFSAQEMLQYWIDLLLSGIGPRDVKLLGINGGEIAAAEFRLALALGCRVAIVEGSGRQASELLHDRDWQHSLNLVHLPADGSTARAFIGFGSSILDAEQREAIAQVMHAAYRRLQADRLAHEDPALAEWDRLQESFKESNRQRAENTVEKLRQIGYSLHPVVDREIELMEFSEAEIESLAETEHGRWVAERLLDGWVHSEERDPEKKVSPYLVPWSQLPEGVKAWDRETVRRIPRFLAQAGLEVRRQAA